MQIKGAADVQKLAAGLMTKTLEHAAEYPGPKIKPPPGVAAATGKGTRIDRVV